MTNEARNLQKAEQLYETAAKLGDAEAAFKLGQCYLDGKGVTANTVKALKWLKKAAKMAPSLTDVDGVPVANNAVVEAQYTLGVVYRDGLGVKSDKKAAVTWFGKAAAHGHPSAQYSLCCCYLDSDGFGVDYDKALHWCTEAANAGLREAQYKLSVIYEKGLGVPVNYEIARKWFQRAAETGLESAIDAIILPIKLCHQAAEFVKGSDGITRDLGEAERLFKMAAERGYGQAQYRLAYFYAEEVHNQKEAFQWLRKGAKNGNSSAEIHLAEFYIEGRGCQRDPEKGKKWALKAKTHGLHQQARMLIRFIDGENVDTGLKAGYVYPEERVLEKFEKESGLEPTGVRWKKRQRRFFESIVSPQFPNLVQKLENIFEIGRPFSYGMPAGGFLGTLCRTKRSKTAFRYAMTDSCTYSAITEATQQNFEKAVQYQYKALQTWSPMSAVKIFTVLPVVRAINIVLHKYPDSPEANFCHLFLPCDPGHSISLSQPYFRLSRGKRFPETVETCRFNGYVKFLERNYHEAKRAFTRTLQQQNNDNTEMYYFRAMTSLMAIQRQPFLASAAICDFQQYLAKAEPDAEFVPLAYYETGRVFLYLGDKNRAEHCYDLGRAAEDPEVRLPIFPRVPDSHLAILKDFFQRPAWMRPVHHPFQYPTSESPGLVCFQCLKEVSGMKQCGACKIAFYCDKNCQKANWTQHKIICKWDRS